MRIICRTRFDITATGVKSHFNASRMPFQDDSGKTVANMTDWNRSRNQQRNWETVNQLIALRTLPEDITVPVKDGNEWTFKFTVDNPSTIELGDDPVGALTQDCQDVPMLTGLDEDPELDACLIPGRNIRFEVFHDK